MRPVPRTIRGAVRTLHVIETLGPAGTEHALLQLLPALGRLGVACELAVLTPPYTLAHDFQVASVAVHQLSLPRRYDVRSAVARLTALGRKGGFGAVCSHLFLGSVYAALTFIGGPPVIASHHAMDYDLYPSNTFRRKALQTAYGLVMRRLVTAHVATSQAVAGHYTRHLGLKHVAVIPNGFPTGAAPQLTADEKEGVRRSYGVPAGAIMVICPARFSVEKGIEYLIDAVADPALAGSDIHTCLFGQGPLHKDLVNRVRQHKLESRVHIFSPVPQEQLLRAMAAADALVLASPHGEGFGRVLVESMMVGVPVLTTNVGAAPEFVRNERTGLLVPPRDSSALAAALLRLEDPTLRARLADTARREVVPQFDIEAVARQWYDLLLRVTRRRTPGT